MATTTETPVPAVAIIRNMASDSHRGGPNPERSRSNRGGRSRGRGRGSRGGPGGFHGEGNPFHQRQNNRNTSNSSILPAPSLPPPPDLGGGGSFGGRLTEDARTGEGEVGAVATRGGGGDEKAVEAEVCFICASPVVHNAVTACNHRTCHICALRMRALYKNRQCMHCRVILPLPTMTGAS